MRDGKTSPPGTGASKRRRGTVRRAVVADNLADRTDALRHGIVRSPLFQESPVGIAVLDTGGMLVACNRTFAEMARSQPAALTGQPLADLFAPEDHDDLRAQLAKLTLGTSPCVRLDHLRLLVDGGEPRTASFTASSLPSPDGTVEVLVYLLDTTDRSARAVQAAHGQRLQLLGQMAGSVAHDFNNLIAAILGFCELMMARKPGEAPADADLEQIRLNALRGRELVGQLLAFARKRPPRPVRMRTDAAIEALKPTLQRLLGDRIVLITEHRGGPTRVRIEPGQFDQAILNLVANARDAMPRGGCLFLRTDTVTLDGPILPSRESVPAGRYAVVEVEDNGHGIPQEIIGSIFEPFFTTKGEGAGTGLGLASVYGVVRQSGGSISVDSSPGSGTSVRIILPVVEGDVKESAEGGEEGLDGVLESIRQRGWVMDKDSDPAIAVGAGDRGSERKQRVLLVDDEEAFRRFTARALRSRGYDVVEASDAEEALSILARRHPPIDLLLADLLLPGMDGQTLVEHALCANQELRAIYISGQFPPDLWSGDGGLGEAQTDSPRRVLTLEKPFTLAQLASTVQAALDR